MSTSGHSQGSKLSHSESPRTESKGKGQGGQKGMANRGESSRRSSQESPGSQHKDRKNSRAM